MDDSNTSIGKRYARNDELGTPFGVTLDFACMSILISYSLAVSHLRPDFSADNFSAFFPCVAVQNRTMTLRYAHVTMQTVFVSSGRLCSRLLAPHVPGLGDFSRNTRRSDDPPFALRNGSRLGALATAAATRTRVIISGRHFVLSAPFVLHALHLFHPSFSYVFTAHQRTYDNIGG